MKSEKESKLVLMKKKNKQKNSGGLNLCGRRCCAVVVALPSSRCRRHTAIVAPLLSRRQTILQPRRLYTAATPHPSPLPPLNSLDLILRVKCKALVSKTSF